MKKRNVFPKIRKPIGKSAVPKTRRTWVKRAAVTAAGTAVILAGVHASNPKLIPRMLDKAVIKCIFEPIEKRGWLLRNKRLSKNFEMNRARVDVLVKSRAGEIIEKGKPLNYETGGVVYLRNGVMLIEWVVDKDDMAYKKLGIQLRSGDLRKISLNEFEWALERFRANSRHYNKEIVKDLEKMLNEIRMRIEAAQKGIENPLLTEQQRGAFSATADLFERLGQATYGGSGRDRLFSLDKDPNNIAIATFHTHPYPGSLPKGQDLENSRYHPSITFSFEPTGLKVYYIINQKTQERFTIPYK